MLEDGDPGGREVGERWRVDEARGADQAPGVAELSKESCGGELFPVAQSVGRQVSKEPTVIAKYPRGRVAERPGVELRAAHRVGLRPFGAAIPLPKRYPQPVPE